MTNLSWNRDRDDRFETDTDRVVETRLATLSRQIRERDRTLRAFVDLRSDRDITARARDLDRLPAGQRGALHGVALAIKEIIDVAGLRCALGSARYRARMPSTNAALVDRLHAAGSVLLGTVASTEFAIAAAPPTTNPHDSSRTPGGSSSGAAASVGAGLVDLAIGTQTIGSIIRPAAYCGIIGFKPSYGLIPSGAGVMPLAPTLDHVGLLCSDMALLRTALQVLGETPQADTPDLTGLCIPAPWFTDTLSSPVRQALQIAHDSFRAQGLACREQSLPAAIADENRVTTDILLYEMARHITPRATPTGPDVSDKLRHMLDTATTIDETRYRLALQTKYQITQAVHRMLRPGEVILAPATVDIAPRRTDGTGSRAPQRLWSLCGMPALTLPVIQHTGLPVGIQLIGRQGEDLAVLAAGERLSRQWQ